MSSSLLIKNCLAPALNSLAISGFLNFFAFTASMKKSLVLVREVFLTKPCSLTYAATLSYISLAICSGFDSSVPDRVKNAFCFAPMPLIYASLRSTFSCHDLPSEENFPVVTASMRIPCAFLRASAALAGNPSDKAFWYICLL